ncbi:MAG: hypothetical protein RL260_3108 [Pseudomonadota bacterium]
MRSAPYTMGQAPAGTDLSTQQCRSGICTVEVPDIGTTGGGYAPPMEPPPPKPIDHPDIPQLGVRGDVQTYGIPQRAAPPAVDTGWTSRCANGMCADTTSTASIDGHNTSYIGPGKTVNHNVVPADTFAARRIFEAGNRAVGYHAQRDLGTINRDWDTQGIQSLRQSPEFSGYVDHLRPLFGDAAEAVATRNMSGAEGMQGGYANSAHFAPDNLARQQAAQTAQTSAMQNRESTKLFDMLGVDPSAFDNQAIGFEDRGSPFLHQQQADGSFASADSPVGLTRGDYGALAQGTNSLTPAYSAYLSGERAANAKASLETGKQIGSGQRAMIRKAGQVEAAGIRADASIANNAARLNAPGKASVGSRQRSAADQMAIDKAKEEQKRLTIAAGIKAKSDAKKAEASSGVAF